MCNQVSVILLYNYLKYHLDLKFLRYDIIIFVYFVNCVYLFVLEDLFHGASQNSSSPLTACSTYSQIIIEKMLLIIYKNSDCFFAYM